MKNKKIWLFVVLPVILAAAAGIILYAVISNSTVSLEMGENGAMLYRSMNCSLRADRVYIAEDGSACIDYTVSAKDDEARYLSFENVEINGWVMDCYDRFPDFISVSGSESGTLKLAEADILERSGITDIYDVFFDVAVTLDRNNENSRKISLTVKDAPQASADRVPAEGEQVMIDTDDFVFVAETAGTGILFGEEKRYVQLYLENRTDKLLFAELYISGVNDLGSSSFCTVRLNPGTKARLPITVGSYDFERFGMTTVDKINLSIDVSDKDNNRVVDYTSFELYFNGYSADTMPEYTRNTEVNETVIVDDDRFSFVIFGAERWDEGTYVVECYIENRTDDSLSLSTEESIINGIEVDRNIDGYGLAAHYKMYENMVFYTEPSDTSETVEEFRFTMDVTCGEDEEVIVSPDQWFEYRP